MKPGKKSLPELSGVSKFYNGEELNLGDRDQGFNWRIQFSTAEKRID